MQCKFYSFKYEDYNLLFDAIVIMLKLKTKHVPKLLFSTPFPSRTVAIHSPGRLAGKAGRPILENLSSNSIPNNLNNLGLTCNSGLSEPLHPYLYNGDYDPCPTVRCNWRPSYWIAAQQMFKNVFYTGESFPCNQNRKVLESIKPEASGKLISYSKPQAPHL